MAKKKTKKKPAKSKELVPIKKGQRCTARVKRCGECDFKYAAGDPTWVCPNCSAHRQCKNVAAFPYSVCRMHGAGGGRPPRDGKFIPPMQVAEAFNAIYNDPKMLSLAFNIAMLEARSDEILRMINEKDSRAIAYEIGTTINDLLDVVYLTDEKFEKAKVDNTELVVVADRLLKLLEGPIIEQKLWGEFNRQQEVIRRLNDTERKWIDQHDMMVPMSQVIEAIAIVINFALRAIKATKDKAWFARQMRALMPGME
ncbi:MAG: hypothetical protein GTN64_08715 [Candidatus Latescibacteria bacterium]|nr:hypothetical protein [Candidatus Latescibacterota bacterium]NIO78681.1 hypothetical protein [Candidatus Latescibacterota bacterium]